jgi:hypothetical protein
MSLTWSAACRAGALRRFRDKFQPCARFVSSAKIAIFEAVFYTALALAWSGKRCKSVVTTLKKGEVTMAEVLTNGSPAKNSDVKMEEGSQKIVPQKAGLEDIVAATSEICFIDRQKRAFGLSRLRCA